MQSLNDITRDLDDLEKFLERAAMCGMIIVDMSSHAVLLSNIDERISMLDTMEHCWGNSPTVSKCDFSITEVGTTVYDRHGNWIGDFATELEVVEAVSELERSYAMGGVNDGIQWICHRSNHTTVGMEVKKGRKFDEEEIL